MAVTGLLATALIAIDPAVASAGTPSAIGALATANHAKKACSVNSLGGTGFATSCTGNGGQPEYWCADFARWVWGHEGVSYTADLNALAASFYSYGSKHGTLTKTPAVGDAAVFNATSTSTTNIHHVAIVTAVNADGTVTVENGDFGGESGSEAHFASTSSVVRTVINATVGTKSSSEGQYLVDYVRPAGV
ncbi:MAG: CHAP domain-containing protein [Jatrophihabitantaceae bacterium]